MDLLSLPLVIHIGIDPVAVALGPLKIRWYGIGYVVAVAVGLWFIYRYAPRRGVAIETLESIAPWGLVAGFAGGRLYYVIQNDPGSYLRDPWRVFEVWHGGMAFFGAILAVAAVVIVFAIKDRLPLPAMLDVAALFALVGQPIGRLGNVVNGDILGPPTDLPWAFVYTHPDSFAPDTVTAYHPAAIYEMLANVVLIAMLFPLRHRLPHGGFVAAYIAGYCVAQLVVFTWRSEPTLWLGLRQAQWTALVLLVIEAGVLAVWWMRARGMAGMRRNA